MFRGKMSYIHDITHIINHGHPGIPMLLPEKMVFGSAFFVNIEKNRKTRNAILSFSFLKMCNAKNTLFTKQRLSTTRKLLLISR
jgi:hypothetical protein